MRKFLSILLVTAAVIPAALAQDNVEALLHQPSTSLPSGRISMPVPEETARREVAAPAPTPVVTETPPVVAMEPVAKPAEKPVMADVAVEPTPLMDSETVAVEVAPPVQQTSLLEVLAKSYASSPTLKAERETLRIQYEEVAQADALQRPVIDADAGVGLTYDDPEPGDSDNFVSRDVGVRLVQPVWIFGRIRSYINQQLKLTDAQIAAYERVSQQVFLNVITAAMDIVRDRAVITLNEKNRQVIAEQLKAAENGFEVGALTRTDVAQAKARLSEADANLAAANANYQSSLARYTQFAGMSGDGVDFAHDLSGMTLPTDLQSAQSLGDQNNPEVVYARYLEQAAEKAEDVARGQMHPDLNLIGTADRDWHTVAAVDNSQNATLGLRATMNLYEGGAMSSRIRQAKIARFEKTDRVEEAQRSVAQQVATAWNMHQAARTSIVALEAQVEAATIARNGVYKEREVGTRTVLDSLDAERELLNAEVGLAQARRDAMVADYSLLAASGQLTPTRLGMMAQNVERDVMETSRKAFGGTGVQPRD